MTIDTADDFTWLDGERLVRFGDGVADEAPALAADRGFDGFALLTTERAAGAARSLVEAASAVVQVPPGAVPEAAAAVVDAVRGRSLVALGGGRVIDSAKAVAGATGVACAAVPTTLSGAEMTGFHRLPAGAEDGRMVRPSLVVADPRLMASQPRADRAASAMNALAHAIEALYTPLANPVATMAALRAAELFAAGVDAEADPRSLALGATLAGYASGLTGFAVHHAVCQTIVRLAGTPHAQTNAVVLPHAVRLVEPHAPAALAPLGRALGEPADAADAVARLARAAGVSGLTALGFDRDLVAPVVEQAAARPEVASTPGAPGPEQLTALVEAAL